MYSKQEVSQFRQAFWTAFGKYMLPIPSAEGTKINWINYKTGVRNIYFKMQAGKNFASISIELTHADEGIRKLYFEQFEQLKQMLESALGEKWIWNENTQNEYGSPLSKIYKEITGVSLFNKADWPALISFFKQRIIALDEFWSNAKYSFDELM